MLTYVEVLTLTLPWLSRTLCNQISLLRSEIRTATNRESISRSACRRFNTCSLPHHIRPHKQVFQMARYLACPNHHRRSKTSTVDNDSTINSLRATWERNMTYQTINLFLYPEATTR